MYYRVIHKFACIAMSLVSWTVKMLKRAHRRDVIFVKR